MPEASQEQEQPQGQPLSFEDFKKVELVIGEVKEAMAHPGADKLLVLKVDMGDGGPRQVVAGLRGFYEPEALVGRQIVVVSNLAPARLRGEQSEGMLLAASVGGEPVLLAPERAVPNGSKVS